MDITTLAPLVFMAGFLLGLGIGLFLLRQAKSTAADMETRLRETFTALSAQTLRANATDFLQLANQTLANQTQSGAQELEGKKQLIDQTLEVMKAELAKVSNQMTDLEKDRAAKFASLSTELHKTGENTRELSRLTHTLSHALTHNRVRGQWGERMAEDILQLAGFAEGINYTKQTTLTGIAAGSRPDFTFHLPQNHVVHMDVKFPLDHYLLAMNADDDDTRAAELKSFIRDVKNRIAEAAKRRYNTGDGVLDYVLVFIPNEAVFSTLHDAEPNLLDDALRQKVILCSPYTLFAVLAVIRQAVENFQLERTVGEMGKLVRDFQDQWANFTEAMEKLGATLTKATEQYESMSTTRAKKLQIPMDKIALLQKDPLLHATATGQPLRVIERVEAPTKMVQ